MVFTVTDGLNGKAVPDANVVAKSKGGLDVKLKSDSNGKVLVGPLAPKDLVNFVITKSGYDFGESVWLPVPDSGGTEEEPATVTQPAAPINPTVSLRDTSISSSHISAVKT